jgi:hypothetical protein
VNPLPAVTSVTVSWTGVGSPIAGYTAQAYLAPTGQSPSATQLACLAPYSAATNSYSCTIHGLAYNTQYVFGVFAFSGGGTGPLSAFSNAITLTPALAQTITFGPIADQSFLVGSMLIHGSSDSGLPVRYTTNTPSVCTIDVSNGALLHFNAAGTCTVTASQGGLTSGGATTNYLPATLVAQSFSITPVDADPLAIVESDSDANDVRVVTFEVDWSKALNLGGSSFVNYEVNWAPHCSATDATCTSFAAATTLSATVTNIATNEYAIAGLTPNMLYDVRVRVNTAKGPSAWSDSLTALIFGAPGAPTAVTAMQATGPGAAKVSWTESTDNGGTPITGYTAEALIAGTLTSTGNTCTAPTLRLGGPMSCTITGLSGSAFYIFRVEAINSVGSTVSTVTDPPLSVGIAQTISINNDTEPHNLGIITLVASATSGLPLSYSVASATPLYTTPSGWSGSRTVCSVGANGKVIIDLAGTCTIRATQDGKDGLGNATYYAAAAAQMATITVTASAPSEVQNGSVRSGSRILLAGWSAPAHDGGAPITGYVISWLPSATPNATPSVLNLPAGTTSRLITGLTNGVTYTVNVQAVNAAGLIGP